MTQIMHLCNNPYAHDLVCTYCGHMDVATTKDKTNIWAGNVTIYDYHIHRHEYAISCLNELAKFYEVHES